MQKICTSLLLLIASFIFFSGCKKTGTVDPGNGTSGTNDQVMVNAQVTGVVLTESNQPVAGAVVTSGTNTTTTNINGAFSFKNISLSKENGFVTVVKAGYFKGIRSFKTSAGKDHSVKIQLMAKVLSGSINGATGGTVASNNGASINFPAACFVTSNGTAYTGTVNVYSRWIDPAASNLPFIIPGDFRGIATDGAENLLETYGMVGAELEDATGAPLKISSGKKATINFPLPLPTAGNAPATIKLWHFDEATARWKENGTAIKQGSSYKAEVDKFSFWNCDVPNANFITLDYTLINALTNTPLVFTTTTIQRVSNGTYAQSITNNTGYISGLVPKDEPLVLQVSSCGAVIFSKNIGPFFANTSLGNINVTLPANSSITFTGTLLNCSGSPVTNGYLSFYGTGANVVNANTNANGAVAFTLLNCPGNNVLYNYIGYDQTSGQRSNLSTGLASGGTVNLGNINVCGGTDVEIYVAGSKTYLFNSNSFRPATLWRNGVDINLPITNNSAQANAVYVSGTDVYVAGSDAIPFSFTTYIAKVWKNGVPTSLTNGTLDAAAYGVFVSGSDVYVAGKEGTFAKLWKNGTGTSLTNGNQYSVANAVYVQGTDVYVAGYEGQSSGVRMAKLWKNGVGVNLSNGTTEAIAYSVFVSGSDVYVGGFERNASGIDVARIWKNNVGTSLSDGTKNAGVRSVFIDGTDVHAAGYEQVAVQSTYRARHWKNGTGTFLNSDTDNTPGMQSSYAKSIFVKGTDVYIVGDGDQYTTIGNGNITKARMWKNGLASYLSDGSGNAFANGIFIK